MQIAFHLDGVNYPGVQVEIFAASTACTGAVTYSVYPVGSCVTVASGYFTSGNLAATLGAQSFQPLCTFANAAQPSIPGPSPFTSFFAARI